MLMNYVTSVQTLAWPPFKISIIAFADILTERVTKIKNIKTDSTKILRPTHFSQPKY